MWRRAMSKRGDPRSPGHAAQPCRRDGRDSTSPNRNWGWLWVRWADNHPQNGRSGSAQGDGGAAEVEEVVALVVDDDEGGEVLDLDLPDRLQLGRASCRERVCQYV